MLCSTRPGPIALLAAALVTTSCAQASTDENADGGDPQAAACDECRADQGCSADGVCLDPLPYPSRDGYRIKGLQPDGWPVYDDVAGANTGAVLLGLLWHAWEPAVKAPPCAADTEHEYDGRCFVVDPEIDAAIREWTTRDVVVTARLYGVPDWARTTRACSAPFPGFEIFCAPDDAADYARFAGMLADRYDGLSQRGRIADFVIHNEVNANDFFDVGCGQGTPCDVTQWLDTYADNYRAAYDAIVAEQPHARTFASVDNHFGSAFDQPAADRPRLSGQLLIQGLADRIGERAFRVALHPYPIDRTSSAFGPEDAPRVTYGNLGVMASWLRKQFPERPEAWEFHVAEGGFNSLAPSSPEGQSQALCDSFRNALGTPGVTSYIYHRMSDQPSEVEGGLALGLRAAGGEPKPAWTTWASANRADLSPPLLACGFEDLPYARLTRSSAPGRGHWASTRKPPAGFVTEASWRILREPAAGTQLVHACAVGAAGAGHNLLTHDPACEGHAPLGPVGWVYQAARADTVPLYRCQVAMSSDRFISSDPACEGQVTELVLGHVLP